MKKLLSFMIALCTIVNTAKAYSTFYLNCDDNSWGNGKSLPFTYLASNSYYYVLSGSHVNNGDFYFRFYAKWDSGNGGHYIMPTNDGDVVSTSSSTPTETNTIWNDDGTTAFKIAQDPSAKAVIIYAYYEDSKFKLYTETLTSSYTVAFTNDLSWSNVYAYAFDNRSPEIKVLGAWPGTQLESTDGVYRVEIPYSNTTKVIFTNNDGSQTSNLDLVDDALYQTTGKISDQSVSINQYGMATFCSQYPLDFSTADGLKAYKITASNKETGELTKEEVTKVPAGVGVYLEGSKSTNYAVSCTATATSISGNMLVGVTESTNISQTAGANTNYILTVNKAGSDVAELEPKFFKVNTAGNTVGANKAYLQIPTNAAREYFWFDDEATGINAVKVSQPAGEIFDLQGRRVALPTKGLYIVNGKKYFAK